MKTSSDLEPTAFRQWRLAHGLTQRRAAELLGVSEQMAYYLDRGERKLQKRHQLLMDAVARGIELRPWSP